MIFMTTGRTTLLGIGRSMRSIRRLNRLYAILNLKLGPDWITGYIRVTKTDVTLEVS